MKPSSTTITGSGEISVYLTRGPKKRGIQKWAQNNIFPNKAQSGEPSPACCACWRHHPGIPFPSATPAARENREPPPCLPLLHCAFQILLAQRSHLRYLFSSVVAPSPSTNLAKERDMQTVRSVVLQHLRLRAAPAIAGRGGSGRPALYRLARGMSAPAGQEDSKGSSSSDPERDVRTRVVNLVKKFDKIDADKVGSCLRSLFSSSPFPLPLFFLCS